MSLLLCRLDTAKAFAMVAFLASFNRSRDDKTVLSPLVVIMKDQVASFEE